MNEAEILDAAFVVLVIWKAIDIVVWVVKHLPFDLVWKGF